MTAGNIDHIMPPLARFKFLDSFQVFINGNQGGFVPYGLTSEHGFQQWQKYLTIRHVAVTKRKAINNIILTPLIPYYWGYKTIDKTIAKPVGVVKNQEKRIIWNNALIWYNELWQKSIHMGQLLSTWQRTITECMAALGFSRDVWFVRNLRRLLLS